MNSKPSSSKATISNETKHNNNVTSKLRRLKIEENLLLQNLKKHEHKRDYEVSESDTNNNVDCENMIRNVKDSYVKIKILFDDIKVVTSSKELLAELEIEEIKQKVLELEKQMKSFKFYLNNELSTLKNAEQELTKQLDNLHFEGANIKKRAKLSSLSFKQAVPSPVRLMMTLPLKCSEVQEFQDFMKNSSNRYGGWNEYHHNIFVKLWQKHFGNSADTGVSDPFVEKIVSNDFIKDCLLKLQGIDERNLMSHIQWFKMYLSLKSKQQSAIDKWKSSRRSLRKIPEDNQVHSALQNEVRNDRQPFVEKRKKLEMSKSTPKTLGKEGIQRVMAPTKQWLSRCSDEPKFEQVHSMDNLEKLGIPSWRQYL